MTLCQIDEVENHILVLSLLDDNEQCALNFIYTFIYYYWSYASAGGLLVPGGIIRFGTVWLIIYTLLSIFTVPISCNYY
jgi:hypothetical protein